MHILILNWRDTKNPNAGGAEVLTHEMAKRWVVNGHKVTEISARFPGCSPEETIDGVTIVRLGTWWSVHLLTAFYYLRNLSASVDVILDEVHWFPFFSILYGGKKTVLLVCEVANGLFFHFFPYPLALIGRMIEKFYLFLYRSVPTLAISPSTKHDLVGEGIDQSHITVLPMGLTVPKRYRNLPKDKKPTLLFIARLTKAKGVEDAIETLRFVRKKADVHLWIAGSGSDGYVEEVKEKIKAYGLVDSVQWWGYVDEQLKFKLMQRAHLLIVPSVKEGWGLTVPEAGWFGTPAVGYDVGGLRDVIQHEKTGLLTKPNASDMSSQIVRLLRDKNRYLRFCRQAQVLAKTYSWGLTADRALSVLSSL